MSTNARRRAQTTRSEPTKQELAYFAERGYVWVWQSLEWVKTLGDGDRNTGVVWGVQGWNAYACPMLSDQNDRGYWRTGYFADPIQAYVFAVAAGWQ